jgi:hypothetical protein
MDKGVDIPWVGGSPPVHGISTPLRPYLGISNPLLWYYKLLSLGRNEGVQFTMRGFKIQ